MSYPAPFVVQARATHRRSLILLHGRGSTGEKFGSELMKSRMSLSDDIASGLPNTKFIFPTAKKRRARWYNRATISQWFDSVPIDEQDSGVSEQQEQWQLEGLRQSRNFLKGIVEAEISSVGAANVFIGGLSQGCAMALHLLLSFDTIPCGDEAQSEVQHLGGFVGMSGWLPFADAIELIIRPETSHSASVDDASDDEDPFGATSDEDGSIGTHEGDTCSVAHHVCNLVRDNMDLEPTCAPQLSWIRTPVLLGHGKNDQKVAMRKGFRAAQCLKDIGVEVIWKEYDEGHWYKTPEQLDDLVAFVDRCRSHEEKVIPEETSSMAPSQ